MSLASSSSALAETARKKLQESFGATATVIVAAPGRVNLIGEHIDYCDGFVLPLAIEQNVIIAAAPNGTSTARVHSAYTTEPCEIDLSVAQEISEPKWANYLRGVIAGFQQRGVKVAGFDAFIVSDVPGGAGLSSSAALECAMATLLEQLTGHTLTKREKGLLAQKAEHDFANVPCGIMDQFASTFGEPGQLILIDCQTGEPEMVPFENPELTILVSNTKVSHQLSDGGYASRRKATEDALATIGKDSWREVRTVDLERVAEQLDPTVYKRARHVIGEIERTIDAAAALKRSEFAVVGELMYQSHESLRDDFEVSCPELDFLVDEARSLGRDGGVIGARMTGGGFGGSTVTLCHAKNAADIQRHLEVSYEEKFGFAPEIFATRPAAGARVLFTA